MDEHVYKVLAVSAVTLIAIGTVLFSALEDWSIVDSFYFSVVTLTTLGYGDVTPNSLGGQVVAMAAVITGYFMLGGLLSILSNKMARRGD